MIAGVLSLVAAFVFAGGLALQQKGNLAALEARRDGRGSRSSALDTIRQPAWLVGFLAAGLGGFVLLAAALRLGSLLLVQTIQVTQILFSVPLGAWVARHPVRREDWLAASALVAALALLIAALAPAAGSASGSASGWRMAVPPLIAVALALALAGRRIPDLAAALLGASSGVLFGVMNAIVKEVTGSLGPGTTPAGLLWWWAPWAAAAIVPVAVVIQNASLRAGRLSAAQTALTTVGPLVSAVLGLAVFGETIELTPLRAIGATAAAALAAVSVGRLARSPDLLAAAGPPGG